MISPTMPGGSASRSASVGGFVLGFVVLMERSPGNWKILPAPRSLVTRAITRPENGLDAAAETYNGETLAVLAARRIAVGDAERVRILGEQDPMELDRWLADAMTCAEVAELFTTDNQR